VAENVIIPVVSFLTSEKSRALDLSALFYCKELLDSNMLERDRCCAFLSSFFLCALPVDMLALFQLWNVPTHEMNLLG